MDLPDPVRCTLTYAENGQVYGIEEYRPNRRVRWAFVGDTCREGYWYDEGRQICFVYEHDPHRNAGASPRMRGA